MILQYKLKQATQEEEERRMHTLYITKIVNYFLVRKYEFVSIVKINLPLIKDTVFIFC